MTFSRCLAALALLPLGCAAETPAATQPAAPVVNAQPAGPVAVVDVNAPAPAASVAEKAEAPKTEEQEKEPEAPPAPTADGDEDVAQVGMIGLLNSGGDSNISALGALTGTDIGDSFGAGGLGLSGVGSGGGGIGTLGVGTLGIGTGRAVGGLSGSSTSPGAKVALANPNVNGRLTPEVIKRIVRQQIVRFRHCYENGLKNNPTLAGEVKVRFVIGKDGAVVATANADSDLPDAGVTACVAGIYKSLSFPQPEGGGVVVVVYPIRFAPANKAAPPPVDKATKAPPPVRPPPPRTPKTR